MESWIEWLPRVGAVLTLIIGLIGFFSPKMFLDQMDIGLNSPKAYSEARTVFGGLNLGLAIAALVMASPAVFTALGISWGMGLLARLWSQAVDGIALKDTIPGVVVDGTLCLLFLAPVLFG